MITRFFENRKTGFYLSLLASVVAVLTSVAYVLVYQLTAGNEVDRVFNWLTFVFILAGGIAGIIALNTRTTFSPMIVTALFSVAFANHVVEFAYPLADAITGVPFFGGNFNMALVFTIFFSIVTICQLISTFMKQNKL